jgi:phosphoglycerate dehydrogenase-like enzyme
LKLLGNQQVKKQLPFATVMSSVAKNLFKIKTFNKISPVGLERFPRANFEVAGEISAPDAIMLRSHKVDADGDVPLGVQAIARCGAGVNNIPVDKMTEVRCAFEISIS